MIISGIVINHPPGTAQDRSKSLQPIKTYQGLGRLTLRVAARSGLAKVGVRVPHSMTLPGYVTPSFFVRFYNRIAIIPNQFEIGAISSNQILTVQVWNAWLTSQTLLSVTVENGEGILLTGPTTPTLFSRLNIKRWTVEVTTEGPSVIDCMITWRFAGLPAATCRITGSRSALWSFAPDWSDGITENLEWKTDVLQSQSGAEQRRSMRLSPRRTFEFKVLTHDTGRQRFENQMAVYGNRVWSLPLWHDAYTLNYDVVAGSNVIVIDTEGRDLQPGGLAMLRYKDRTETVDIKTVLVDSVTLLRTLNGNFPAGTRIYPVRSARLTDAPAIKRMTDGVASAQLRFQVVEHNASSDLHSLPLYRQFPVLEPGSNWSEDISASYQRLLLELDNLTGIPKFTDTAKLPFLVQSHTWLLSGRSPQAELRRIFYYLRGRQRPIWVFTDTSDFYPVTKILGNTFDVQACGFSDNHALMTGRQDIRIQLTQHRVIYCRITLATLINPTTERISIDGAALNIELNEIVKISLMTLCRLESDTLSWLHQTDADGMAEITAEFRGLRDELE